MRAKKDIILKKRFKEISKNHKGKYKLNIMKDERSVGKATQDLGYPENESEDTSKQLI